MGGFFNIDGPFYKFGTVLWDIMALSFLWLLFSLPIVTIGASTTALYYITTRRISKKEGYITKDFWQSFKSNFKQSTLVWLCIMVIGIILAINIYIMREPGLSASLDLPDTYKSILYILQLMFAFELIFFMLYVFPIISRFDIHGKMLIKTTLLMLHKHLPTTILLAALFLTIVIAPLFTDPILYIFAAGLYSYAAAYFFMRIFKKYRPEMDKNPDDFELEV
ncbi:MAG: YesL family protein [Clostridiales bacterium]|nr:YesL family protein [Clostridiales bacterium]